MAEKRRVPWWLSALCLLPWAVVAVPYFEAVVVRAVPSRWPRPMLDDPKQLPTAPLYLVFRLLFMTSFPVLPALVIGLVVWAGFKWRKVLSAPNVDPGSARSWSCGIGFWIEWTQPTHSTRVVATRRRQSLQRWGSERILKIRK
jgi:hypothetical protein